MNNKKIDKTKLLSLLNTAAGESGIDAAKISAALSSGDTAALMDSLPQDGKQQLTALLNDENALKNVLNSPQAAKLIKQLMK